MEDVRKTKKQLIEELNALRLEQIEQTRVTQEKFTKAFLQNSIPATITTVKEGRFVEVSDAFLRLVELKRDEVIGHTSRETEFITEEQRTLFYNELSKSGRIENLEIELRPKGRGLRYGLFNVVMMSINNENYLLTTIQDITDRKQTEAALRDSELKYRSLIEFSSDAIFCVDEKGEYKFTNRLFAKTFGKTPDYFIGKTFWDIYPKEHADYRYEATKRVFQTGKSESLEVEVPLPDKTLYFYATADPIKDETGKVILCLTHATDITERKLVEQQRNAVIEALRDSEEKYRYITDNMSDIVSEIDARGIIKYISPSHQRMFGENHAAQIGKSAFDPIHPEDRDRVVAQYIEAVRTKTDREMEYRYRHVDGHYIWLRSLGHSLFDAAGELVGFIVSSSDISDRKQAESQKEAALETLKKEEEKYRTLIDNIRDGVFILQDAKLQFVNEAFVRMTGYAIEELMQMNMDQLIAPEDAELVAENYRRRQAGEAIPPEYEFRILHKDQKTRVSVSMSVSLIEYRGRVASMGMWKDITDRKRAEADKVALETQNRQLQKSESLGRMAGAIAHHFNNQLGVVVGNLEMAIDVLPKGAPPVSSLTAAMQAAWKAADMSGLMLTYLGQSFDKREPLDISYSCCKILPILKAAMSENVILETDFSSPGPVINTNPDYMQQILTNLITNAWEAVGMNSGNISLSIKTVSLAEIATKNHFPVDWQSQDNAYACLEVTDTGSGIEGKNIEKLFDPFYSTKFTGRGMGLAVVLGIVKTHKGVLTVESKPKLGSTFRVFFPLSEEALQQPQKAEKKDDSLISAVSPGKFEEGGTVLVVEDEEPLRRMITTMLKRLGFSVLATKDGLEALEVFGQHQSEIKFVISDLTMPRMNGWEALTALRKLQPDIPVILASGYDKAHVMEGDHPELPQAFLSKPYDRKALSDAISQVFGQL